MSLLDFLLEMLSTVVIDRRNLELEGSQDGNNRMKGTRAAGVRWKGWRLVVVPNYTLLLDNQSRD